MSITGAAIAKRNTPSAIEAKNVLLFFIFKGFLIIQKFSSSTNVRKNTPSKYTLSLKLCFLTD